MEAFNQDIFLLEHLAQDTRSLKLFKQLAFLIHRNTYGGLNMHDLEVLHAIKKKLAKLLDEPEKRYLTNIIDSLSMYNLSQSIANNRVGDIIKNELYDYVAKQDPMDLCDLFIEHHPKNNSLLLSIKIDENALELTKDLMRFTIENPPDKIVNPVLKPCNIWEVIKNAEHLEDNHIHIGFVQQDNKGPSFLCHKGLCMAEQVLQDVEADRKEEELNKPKKKIEKPTKPYKPSFSHGIVSLVNKFRGSKLESNVVIVQDSKEKKKPYKESSKNTNNKEQVLVKSVEGEVVTDEMQRSIEENRKTVPYKGSGFIDIEQGFLFNIT